MRSAHHSAQTGPGLGVRLVAVVAVLVGVVVLHGPRCSDGMIAAMASPAHGLTMAMAAVTTQPQHPAALCAADRAPDTVTLVADNSSRSGNLGGFLGSCLAFVVTILAAVAGLYPGWLRSVLWRRARRHATRVCAFDVRVPRLTQLGILRT